MGVFDYKLRHQRTDQSPYLFHFTSGDANTAASSLRSILESEKLKSNRGFISFTASPITALRKFFQTKVNRTCLPMYQPYGIGFSRDILVKQYGARNVIYSSIEELDLIPESLRWRSERLDVDVYDYEYLREWRIKGREFDFSSFPHENMLIITPTRNELHDLIVKHDMVFKPIVDYINGDIEPDWDEVFVRQYKGLTLEEALSEKDDYSLSTTTITQTIGEDMTDELFGPNLFVTYNKHD